jgi:hypothetical protein
MPHFWRPTLTASEMLSHHRDIDSCPVFGGAVMGEEGEFVTIFVDGHCIVCRDIPHQSQKDCKDSESSRVEHGEAVMISWAISFRGPIFPFPGKTGGRLYRGYLSFLAGFLAGLYVFIMCHKITVF